MQVTQEKVNTVSSDGFKKVLMGIDPSNLSLVAHMFRDQIYSDAEMAVVREYLCNAIDEHVTHGIQRPVEITLTKTSVKFRDFAKGLSEESVLNVFFQYLASTKKGEEHGGFGIGAKSGHAYSDIFYVSSYFDGTKTTYAGVLEDNGGPHPDGMVNILGSEPTTETGIEIEVPLKEGDKDTFEANINKIARFSKNQFLFNGILVGGVIPDKWETFDNYIFRRKNGSGEVSVRLGDIVYPTSKTIRVKGLQVDLIILADSVNDCSLPPSRESVKMDQKSTQFIDKQIADFSGKLTAHLQALYDNAQTHYERFDIRNTYSIKVDEQAEEAAVLALSSQVESACVHSNGCRKYCGLYSLEKNDLVVSFYRRVYLFHTGLSKVKREYFAVKFGNSTFPDNKGEIAFVQFENKEDGEKWAEDLGIPKDKFAWADQFTFPKVEASTRQAKVTRIRYYDYIDGGTKIRFNPELDGVIYLESYKRQPIAKYDRKFYYGMEIVVVPRYLRSQIPDSWIHADEILDKKVLDLSEKMRDNMGEYVKHYIASNYDNRLLVQSYFKFKGRKNRLVNPKVEQAVVEVASILPAKKEVDEIVFKIITKIENKTNTWQFRAVMALSELSEPEFQLAKQKILA